MARIYTLPITPAKHTESAPSQKGGDFLVEYIRHDGNKYSEHRHCLLTARIDGVNQALRLTEPSEYNPDYGQTTIVRLPGLGEVIENGVGLRMHTELSDSFPSARVITIANSGHGKLNQGEAAVNWQQAYGIEGMARQRLQLLEQLDSDRLIIVATSLGSRIAAKMLILNLEEELDLPVAGNIWYAPATAPPGWRSIKALSRFVPEFMADSAMEVAWRSTFSLSELIGSTALITSSVSSFRLKPKAASAQFADLARGLPLDQLEKIATNYQLAVIQGSSDSFKDRALWLALEERYENLSLHEVKGRGHGMTLNPVRAVHKIAKTIRESGLMPAAALAKVASS